MAWYAMALALRFQLPLEIVLILLVERHTPAVVAGDHLLDLGAARFAVRFRVVRLWEMDPRPVLEADRLSLLPWVTLMRLSPGTLEEAAGRIASSGSARTAGEFVVLGGLYDKSDLVTMLGRLSAMLSDEIIKESSFYQMILQEGIEKGIEKGIGKGIDRGLQAGRVQGAQRVLRRIVAQRFPRLKDLAELKAVSDLDRIVTLTGALLKAKDTAAARAAIRRAGRS